MWLAQERKVDDFVWFYILRIRKLSREKDLVDHKQLKQGQIY